MSSARDDVWWLVVIVMVMVNKLELHLLELELEPYHAMSTSYALRAFSVHVHV